MNAKEIVYWKQRNGTFIDIDSMDVQHLRNVLKMIVKNSNKHKEHKRLMEISPEKSFEEIQLNGDMAKEFHESYLSDEDDDRFDD
jgi:ABC-type histidine transport system ATPase subunit